MDPVQPGSAIEKDDATAREIEKILAKTEALVARVGYLTELYDAMEIAAAQEAKNG